MNIKSVFKKSLLLISACGVSTIVSAGVQTGNPDIYAQSGVNQGCDYDSINGVLTITSTPSVLTISPEIRPEFITGGVLTITANVDAGGTLTTGTVTVTGMTNTYMNPLIEGDLTSFAISDLGIDDRSEFTFDVTAGTLATTPGYAGIGSEGGVIVTMEGSTYSGAFDADWICGVTKINVGPTPAAPVGTGTGTIGYWKTHPDAWPVQEVTLGDDPAITYTQDQAIEILGMAVKGDKTISMAKQLIGAKLNILAGNDSSCIDATIAASDTWISNHGGVGSRQRQWNDGDLLHDDLDAYNNGQLCAPHRD